MSNISKHDISAPPNLKNRIFGQSNECAQSFKPNLNDTQSKPVTLFENCLADEDILIAESFANWGRREISNRKKQMYRRKCKGVYQCTNATCSTIMKEKQKCTNCHSEGKHVACHAIVYYKINCDNTLSDIRRQGEHSCHVFIAQTSHNNPPNNEVSSVPFDIDGDVSYTVSIEQGSSPWDNVSDGRKWGKYEPIKADSDKKIYQRKCKGELVCCNIECPFALRYGKQNNGQFEKIGESFVCRECKNETTCKPCPAKKTMILTNGDTESVLVRHEGDHTCSPIKKTKPPDQISNLTKILPNIKPAVAANTILKTALHNGNTPDEMSELASKLVNQQQVQKKKRATTKKIYPHGTSVKAVKILSESLKEKGHDDYLIYNICEEPVMVLTTSKEKLQIACDLTNKTEIWTTLSPYAHIDFQPSRVCGMNVLGVNCYHPNLKEMVCLFKLYGEVETTPVVEHGLRTFNEAIKSFSKGTIDTFDPAGWMSDESGAILAALENIYGADVHDRLATCQMHYAMSVSRLRSSLSPDTYSTFSNLAYRMEHDLTVYKYQESAQTMLAFVQKQRNAAKLERWFKWWDERKYHWAKAFRPKNNTPSTNLSEPVHSSEKARGSVNVRLIDAIQDDITSAYMLKEKLVGYEEGHYTGGSSKSLIDLAEESEQQQVKRAHAYASSHNSCTMHEANAFVVDKSSTHREDTVRDEATGYVKNKDSKVASRPTISQGREVRAAKTRDVASQCFNNNKTRAINEYCNYSIIEDVLVENDSEMSKMFVIMKKQYSSEDYQVHISKSPSCGCAWFKENKGRQICKHIIMVLLSLGVNENDPLLYQISYTQSELYSLVHSKVQEFRPAPCKDKSFLRLKHRFYLVRYEKGSTRGIRPKCVSCREPLDDGIIIAIDGKYRYKTHSKDYTFRYHAKDACITKPPKYSDIKVLPLEINRGVITNDELNKFKIQLKTKIV